MPSLIEPFFVGHPPSTDAQVHARGLFFDSRQVVAMLDRDEQGELRLIFRTWSERLNAPIEIDFSLPAKDAGHLAENCRQMLRDPEDGWLRNLMSAAGFLDLVNGIEAGSTTECLT